MTHPEEKAPEPTITAPEPLKTRILNRAAILAAEGLTRELVEVPEWGGAVYVRELSGTQRDAFEASVMTLSDKPGEQPKPNLTNARAKLVALSAVDEEGKSLFTLDDVAVLGRKSARALDRVVTVAQRLSGLSASDLEGILGNSPGAPSGASGFASL